MGIRPAKPTEAGLLSSLAFESKAYWGYSLKFMDACRDELTVSVQNIQSESICYQVYEKNDDVIGFYAIKFLSQVNAELEALFVKPDYIGQGIGRALECCKQLSILK